MVRIYNRDGSCREYSEDEVDVITITADNIAAMKNHNNGVNIIFKDGSIKFIDNAETDGISLSISDQKE